MACVVMAYIVMAYNVMAYILVAYRQVCSLTDAVMPCMHVHKHVLAARLQALCITGSLANMSTRVYTYVSHVCTHF